MDEGRLRWQPISILLCVALIWGANMAVIKIGARQLPPLFMAGIRSSVAALCLCFWIKAKRMPLFPSRGVFLHGMVVGLLSGSEFCFVYLGLLYTSASRIYILIYTAPFFAALGAHLFLGGDRINGWKAAGLLLAFAGVTALFLEDLGSFSLRALPGDVMGLLAGLMWGATSVYIKRFLSGRTLPLQTLFYQVFFSALPLLLLSAAVGERVCLHCSLS